MEANEKNQMLFGSLVIMFHAATMQQLGKVKNPITDKIERDLSAAQNSIDMLEMLRQKTKGNLGEQEERLLNDILREVRLNFVDEANKPPPAPEKAAQGGPTP